MISLTISAQLSLSTENNYIAMKSRPFGRLFSIQCVKGAAEDLPKNAKRVIINTL